MKICDLLNVDLLADHLLNGMVSLHTHPESRHLAILNYTHRAQHAQIPLWGDGTIDWCRGLIYDLSSGDIVALPFKKFHNLNTPQIPETMYENLPWGGNYSAAEKVDGSLGIYYKWEDIEGIATRGSFTSAQAIFATRWFKENVFHEFWPEHLTPLFEIVYPENRIVVDYHGYAGLVLIGMMDKRTGTEVNWADVQALGRGKIRLAKDYSRLAVTALTDLQIANTEGFVVTFDNGLKVKIKTDEYKRLHRIMAAMNPRTLWESLSGHYATAIDGRFPENFTRWMRLWQAKFESEFNDIYQEVREIYDGRPEPQNDAREYRSACAHYFKERVGDRTRFLPILFAMLDNRDYETPIWKLIEPRGDDKTFKTPEDLEEAA